MISLNNIRLGSSVTTFCPQGRLVGRNKVTMPREEVALPNISQIFRIATVIAHYEVYAHCLQNMGRDEVVKSVPCAWRYFRRCYGWPIKKTLNSREVVLLSSLAECSPGEQFIDQ